MAKRQKASGVSEAQTECNRLIETALASRRVRLRLSIENQDWVAIEGDRESLAFLGELLSSFAKDEGPGCLILDSPEMDVFHTGSLGIYIYRKAEDANRTVAEPKAAPDRGGIKTSRGSRSTRRRGR